MRIYIPSRGRSDRRFLTVVNCPLAWLSPDLRRRTVYVVRDEEVAAYRRSLDALGHTDVEVWGCGSPANLSEKRELIATHARERGEGKFMMVDDDVILYVRKGPDDWHLKGVIRGANMAEDSDAYVSWREVEHLIGSMEAMLDEYCMVGVSTKEGNNRYGTGEFPMVRECTRSMRMYAFRTEDYLSIEAGRLPEMADFDTTLQFLRSGRKNALICYWAQGHVTSQHHGGCSIYRTTDTHERVCHQLAELHPGFVRLVQKANKGGQHGFGTRTEVTIRWVDAYKSSQGAAS